MISGTCQQYFICLNFYTEEKNKDLLPVDFLSMLYLTEEDHLSNTVNKSCQEETDMERVVSNKANASFVSRLWQPSSGNLVLLFFIVTHVRTHTHTQSYHRSSS